MTARIVKELKGFSGSEIYLMKENETLFVRKLGKVKRNTKKMLNLSEKGFVVPKVYDYSRNRLDMEYVHGLDMKTYLTTHNTDHITQFLQETFQKLSKDWEYKDYTDTYQEKLSQVDFDELPFSMDEIINKAPKKLPCTEYHGDLTLENILYTPKGFVLIDCVTTEYDSFIFDIAKLRQDLELGWFNRYNPVNIQVKLLRMQKAIVRQHKMSKSNVLLILMLLRVYRYTKPNTLEREFIQRGIKKLWK